MTPAKWLFLTAFALSGASPAVAADWKPVETAKPYAVSGRTGPELYASIGENGPKLGMGRAIALTTFDLKWSRKYEPSGTTCRLVSAKPWLTITYALPKPRGRLPAPTQRLWDVFIDGITRHEKVHGDFIREMTQATLDRTVGLEVADDPGCKKIRQQVAALAMAASVEQRDRSRAFDGVEMSQGANIHQLILGLVNGK